MKDTKAILTDVRIFVDFQKFLKFHSRHGGSIIYTTVKPPKLGSSGYGTIEVTINPIKIHGKERSREQARIAG